MSETILISSKYFDIGIQTLPNIAVHHFKKTLNFKTHPITRFSVPL